MDESSQDPNQHQVISASREIAAPAAELFELIADPAQQPRWDGNDNLAEAPEGQRVRAVGDVFRMLLTKGAVRRNHVVEFEEGRLIAWTPGPEDGLPFGQLWRWRLEPIDEHTTEVEHSYDWSALATDPSADPKRVEKARNMRPEQLRASIDRLAALVERPPAP